MYSFFCSIKLPCEIGFGFMFDVRTLNNCILILSEIVRAMTQVISTGMAMYWGTSKWTPVEIMEAYSNCRQFNCITPIAEQAEYHFFCRDKPELYMQELYNKIGTYNKKRILT